MELSALTESTIRQRTTEKSWARGWEYYEIGMVRDVVWRDNRITAKVSGSAYEPYIVEITFDDQGVSYADCTCPYDWGGDCKHIVAVLLHLLHHTDEIDEKPSMTALLDSLNEEQLRALLQELANVHPQIVDDIDAFVAAQTSASADTPTTVSKPELEPPTINLDLLRRQIKADLRNSLNTGYDQWGDSWYDSDLGEALEPGLQEVWGLLEDGKARQALVVLEAMADGWEEGIDSLDEYVLDSFEDIADEFTTRLGEAWAEALLMADLSEEEREEWAAKLDDLVDSMFGGSSLEIAVVAAEQGWDYPPLVAAMQGDITEKGAWEETPPFFADELTRIRLGILAQRERYQEYLNLALAEGQLMLYLQMLVQVGRSQEALQEGMAHLTMPDSVLRLARTLAEHGEIDKSVRLALHGLGLEEDRGKAALAMWLRNLAQEQGMADLALEMAEQALALRVSLENYLALQQIAGKKWADLKPEALRTVAQKGESKGQVDIYLHEGMHEEAIDAVEKEMWFFDIEKVIDAVKETHPDWAFRRCARQAEQIMNAGKSGKYDVAVSWLRRGRDILLEAGENQQWEAYLAGLMEKHQRKYKLRPMLQALRAKR